MSNYSLPFNSTPSTLCATPCFFGECRLFVLPSNPGVPIHDCICQSGWQFDDEVYRQHQCTRPTSIIAGFFWAYMIPSLLLMFFGCYRSKIILNLDFSEWEYVRLSLQRVFVHFLSPQSVRSRSATLVVRLVVAILFTEFMALFTLLGQEATAMTAISMAFSFTADYLLGWILILVFFEPRQRYQHTRFSKLRRNLNIWLTLSVSMTFITGIAQAAATSMDDLSYNQATWANVAVFYASGASVLAACGIFSSLLMRDVSYLASTSTGSGREQLSYFVRKMKVARFVSLGTSTCMLIAFFVLIATLVEFNGTVPFNWVVSRFLFFCHLTLSAGLLYFLTLRKFQKDVMKNQPPMLRNSSKRKDRSGKIKQHMSQQQQGMSPPAFAPPPPPGQGQSNHSDEHRSQALTGLDDTGNTFNPNNPAASSFFGLSPRLGDSPELRMDSLAGDVTMNPMFSHDV